MNLSALNTGLTQAPIPSATEANAALAGQQRAPAGTLSGEDFAAFLRNQIRALKNNERQDIAAAPAPSPAPPAPPRAEHLSPYRPVREASDGAQRDTAKPVKAKESAHADAPDHAHARLDAAKNAPAESSDSSQPHSVDQAPVDATAPETPSKTDASTQVAAPLDPTVAPEPAKTAPPMADGSLAANAAQLTTIPLSPSINIITTAQSQPNDQSVADFALAMGLDPSQVQALFGPTTTVSSPQNNVSTQQMLGMNSMPVFNASGLQKDASLSAVNLPLESLNLSTAVSTADFQELKASATPTLDATANSTLNALSNLNIQLATAQLTPNATPAMPVSTLAVLSMMDTELRAEDIDALKNEFDALAPTTDLSGLGLGDHGTGASAVNHTALPAKAAVVLANNPNMAQTFDKLSEKLATELASRMNDQLNAGEWKMKFALKPASLGLVDVQLEMRDGRLTAQFNADTNLTQDLIQNGSQRLKEALGQLGMNNASVLVGQGQTQQQSHSGQSGQSGLPSRRDDNRVTLADETAPELRTTAKPRHSNSLQFDNYA